MPANALWVTNGLVQTFLLITLFSKASYLALISLSTAMILVPYVFSAGYALWLAWQAIPAAKKSPRTDVFLAGMATMYCAWLLYAAGTKYLLLSALLYAPGMLVYIWAKRQLTQPIFNAAESVAAITLWVLAAVAGFMLMSERITL